MSLDVDQEILEDFLVEAGEILELLSEQLVDLEQRPDDRDLLNAIFRGFHTVKGGAGFLQLEAMVECCHKAENLFDQLRNGELAISPELMDVVLQALDAVNVMFEAVREGLTPEPADPGLINQLIAYTSGTAPAPAAAPASASAPVPASLTPQPAPVAAAAVAASPAPEAQDASDAEFELLLNALDESNAASEAAAPTSAPASAGDELITDDEFEALLDELQSKGEGAFSQANAATPPAQPNAPVAKTDDGLITDDEFEALLDDLQAKGEGAFSANSPAEAPTTPAAAVAPPVATVAAPQPAATPAAAAKVADNKPAPAAQHKPAAESNVRVDTRLLDKIMNMVGELVLVRNRLVRLGVSQEDEEMGKALATLDMVTADLQMSVMKTRMQPVKKVFGRFPRLIRDLSRSLKKEVNLELRGEETDLDKNLVEALADPLIHLVRNAVDHGIESPEERERLGKPREGNVLLSAEQEGDHILLIIQDDGAGMDADKLRNLAVQRGMLDQEAASRLTEQECYNLIFQAGFSTKTEISDVSGRGVGMDVVKTKITQLNGTLSIDSVIGQGSRIAIQVPLTLAIMPTLMVILEGQAFALPLVNVNEIFNLDLTKTNIVDGQQVIIVRDQALPLFHLKRWLIGGKHDESLPEQGHVVIVTVGTQRVGFVVDQLVGQEEVVIKPLGTILHGTPGLSGATITGDGRIALIIDIPNLLKRYAR
ncbi:chemotaxis protein CheA [Pontibacterium granulatum]|uniref:chemotaxis protein CheA n=1 Tax=Pontibacterium granulatum TaxID=2036029 RepID=UPI00249C697E|nr:chemotaxis protein CheA [Pontibacterium granulatum]MDI3322869.1 chemotaxis protein CheA [Pontibacterium granulatum]